MHRRLRFRGRVLSSVVALISLGSAASAAPGYVCTDTKGETSQVANIFQYPVGEPAVKPSRGTCGASGYALVQDFGENRHIGVEDGRPTRHSL